MEECTHKVLGFNSGGFYISCHGCRKTWVAIDHNLGKGDVGIDYTRVSSHPDVNIKRRVIEDDN